MHVLYIYIYIYVYVYVYIYIYIYVYMYIFIYAIIYSRQWTVFILEDLQIVSEIVINTPGLCFNS